MTEQHPLLSQLITTCKAHNIDEMNAHLLLDSYIELCEVKKLWDVDYHFNPDLKVFYLVGKPKRNCEKFNIYVPINSDKNLSPAHFQKLITSISPNSQSFILILKERDSSSSYYRVTSGLVKPDSIHVVQKRKMEETKLMMYQKNLIKSRKKLLIKAAQDEQVHLSVT